MAPETLATNLYLGRVVAMARQRKGWHQTDLAEAAGIGRSLLMDIETGRAGITPERRTALVRALGLQPDALDPPGFVLLSAREREVIDRLRDGKATLPRRQRALLGLLVARPGEVMPC